MIKILDLNFQRVRYLVVGSINTLLGYTIGVSLYKFLSNQVSVIYIGIYTNVICITISFLTYKYFVFKTKGRWLSEYLRAFVVYGVMASIGVFLLWFFIDICLLNIWIAQALIIILTMALSYVGHAKFTFKKSCH